MHNFPLGLAAQKDKQKLPSNRLASDSSFDCQIQSTYTIGFLGPFFDSFHQHRHEERFPMSLALEDVPPSVCL
jgi:hypothetical protein